LLRNERESLENFEARLSEGEVFNYCATIVDLFCRFMSQQQIHSDVLLLANNELWQMFWKDVDLFGTDYEVFWLNAEKLASVYGFVGILVDKPMGVDTDLMLTRADEIHNMAYPYCSLFIPENVHDWKFIRNKRTARPELIYLKLKEDDGYLVWTIDEWERWELKEGYQNEYELTEAGINPLGEIPFIWHTNYNNLQKPQFGISDIKGIAPIQAAITRDLSNGNEIIKYAAFPMMRKPQLSTISQPAEGDDVTGVTAILEFDPEFPNSKPDWLEAKVLEPINAILLWLERKVQEIYRNAQLSNVHGQASTSEAKSGVALRYEYQQLSASLTAKGKCLDESEQKMVHFWLKWQGISEVFKDIIIKRLPSFGLDDLSIQLDHCIMATSVVQVDSFKKALRKKVARLVLPDENEELIATIDDEIDAMKDEFLEDSYFGDNKDDNNDKDDNSDDNSNLNDVKK
jgi:hypothetical protein